MDTEDVPLLEQEAQLASLGEYAGEARRGHGRKQFGAGEAGAGEAGSGEVAASPAARLGLAGLAER